MLNELAAGKLFHRVTRHSIMQRGICSCDIIVTCCVCTGYFAYLEASGRQPGSYANLRLPSLAHAPSDPPYLLRFYYYMYGEHVDRLEVRQHAHGSNSDDRVLFSRARQGSKCILLLLEYVYCLDT